MTVQKDRKYVGGRKVAEKGGLDLDLQDVADDLAELRSKLISTLTQLDTEGGLGGGYVSGNTPDAMKTVKG